MKGGKRKRKLVVWDGSLTYDSFFSLGVQRASHADHTQPLDSFVQPLRPAATNLSGQMSQNMHYQETIALKKY